MANDVAMPPIRVTDPEARLLRKGKGKEVKLAFLAHALIENHHGLLVDFQTTQATGTAEQDTVPVLAWRPSYFHISNIPTTSNK